jgi:hypothetical protein
MTKGSMKSVVAAAAFALASTAPFSAHAVCVVVGQPASLFQGATQSVFVYSDAAGASFFCSILDARLEVAAAAATAAEAPVGVVGDAAVCPQFGTPFRVAGRCTNVFINP